MPGAKTTRAAHARVGGIEKIEQTPLTECIILWLSFVLDMFHVHMWIICRYSARVTGRVDVGPSHVGSMGGQCFSCYCAEPLRSLACVLSFGGRG